MPFLGGSLQPKAGVGVHQKQHAFSDAAGQSSSEQQLQDGNVVTHGSLTGHSDSTAAAAGTTGGRADGAVNITEEKTGIRKLVSTMLDDK